jgi:hypothetical protein
VLLNTLILFARLSDCIFGTLGEHHAGELHVLDHYSFYHPGWEKEAAHMLFAPLKPGEKVPRVCVCVCVCVCCCCCHS